MRDEALDVVAQLLGRHRGVFDERDRLAVAPSSPSTGRARPRGSSRSPACAGGVEHLPHAAAAAGAAGRARRACHPRHQLVERARRRTPRTAATIRRRSIIARRCASSAGVALGVRQDEVVHHLDGRRPVLAGSAASRRARRAGRSNSIVSTAFCAGSGTRPIVASTMKPSVPSEPTMMRVRSTGARRIDERIEVVAADAAQHLREAALDLRRHAATPSAGIVAIRARLDAVARRGRVAPAGDRAAGSARARRRTAPRAARARDRWSCRRAPSARRSSCWPSCRRRWRGSPTTRRARSAGCAAAARRSARRAPRPARPAPSARRD